METIFAAETPHEVVAVTEVENATSNMTTGVKALGVHVCKESADIDKESDELLREAEALLAIVAVLTILHERLAISATAPRWELSGGTRNNGPFTMVGAQTELRLSD